MSPYGDTVFYGLRDTGIKERAELYPESGAKHTESPCSCPGLQVLSCVRERDRHSSLCYFLFWYRHARAQAHTHNTPPFRTFPFFPKRERRKLKEPMWRGVSINVAMVETCTPNENTNQKKTTTTNKTCTNIFPWRATKKTKLAHMHDTWVDLDDSADEGAKKFGCTAKTAKNETNSFPKQQKNEGKKGQRNSGLHVTSPYLPDSQPNRRRTGTKKSYTRAFLTKKKNKRNEKREERLHKR